MTGLILKKTNDTVRSLLCSQVDRVAVVFSFLFIISPLPALLVLKSTRPTSACLHYCTGTHTIPSNTLRLFLYIKEADWHWC